MFFSSALLLLPVSSALRSMTIPGLSWLKMNYRKKWCIQGNLIEYSPQVEVDKSFLSLRRSTPSGPALTAEVVETFSKGQKKCNVKQTGAITNEEIDIKTRVKVIPVCSRITPNQASLGNDMLAITCELNPSDKSQCSCTSVDSTVKKSKVKKTTMVSPHFKDGSLDEHRSKSVVALSLLCKSNELIFECGSGKLKLEVDASSDNDVTIKLNAPNVAGSTHSVAYRDFAISPSSLYYPVCNELKPVFANNAGDDDRVVFEVEGEKCMFTMYARFNEKAGQPWYMTQLLPLDEMVLASTGTFGFSLPETWNRASNANKLVERLNTLKLWEQESSEKDIKGCTKSLPTRWRLNIPSTAATKVVLEGSACKLVLSSRPLRTERPFDPAGVILDWSNEKNRPGHADYGSYVTMTGLPEP